MAALTSRDVAPNGNSLHGLKLLRISCLRHGRWRHELLRKGHLLPRSDRASAPRHSMDVELTGSGGLPLEEGQGHSEAPRQQKRIRCNDPDHLERSANVSCIVASATTDNASVRRPGPYAGQRTLSTGLLERWSATQLDPASYCLSHQNTWRLCQLNEQPPNLTRYTNARHVS
jgi:hypothetical protein